MDFTSDLSSLSSGKIVFICWEDKEDWPVDYISDSIYELLHIPASKFMSGEISYASIIHPDDIERVK